MKTIFKIIFIVICLSVLGGVAFGVYRLTGGFKGDVALFYVTYKDERVTDLDYNLLYISSEQAETFEVVYVLDEFTGTTSDYNVTIKPSLYKQDFHYRVDTVYYEWSKIDLSKAFIIEKSASSFTVQSVTNSFEEMISLIHNGGQVKLPEFTYDSPLFCIEVTSSNGSNVVNILFDLADSRFTKVLLDKEEMIIG